MPRIVSVETAVPEYRHTQAEVLEMFSKHFAPLLAKNGYRAIFERAGVEARHAVGDRDYYFRPDFCANRNKEYLRHALALAERCITNCLKRASIHLEEVTHIFGVTTTGLLTPSLEAHLAQRLPFRRDVKRTPRFGAGCAGSAVGLARAADYLRGDPEGVALLLSVELCSLTFLPQDASLTQLIATALFGDGAACAFLAGDRALRGIAGVEILASESRLIPNSLSAMGWNFSQDGMRLILSPEVPKIIAEHFPPFARNFLSDHDLSLEKISRFILHPGSAKILDAFEKSLPNGAQAVRMSRHFLKNFGNLSSASVLFVLRDALEGDRPPAGSHGLLAAMGPGFASEMSLLRFS